MYNVEQLMLDLLQGLELGEISLFSPVHGGLLNYVFRVEFEDNRCIFLKHASSKTKSDKLGATLSHLSQDRLFTEKKALDLMNTISLEGIEIPRVIHFDHNTHTIIMTEICPGGNLLEDDLKKGIFDINVAKKASLFLVKVHRSTSNIDPIRKSRKLDLSHWIRMLNLRSIYISVDTLNKNVSNNLENLKNISENSCETVFMNLDFCPKNILVDGSNIGVIDFELCSSIGDPAYDLGFFLGHYLIWGIETGNIKECMIAVESSIDTFSNENSQLWNSIYSRVPNYIGATILYRLRGESRLEVKNSNIRLLNIGANLLFPDFAQTVNPKQKLWDTIAKTA